jgi:hypothetical protein
MWYKPIENYHMKNVVLGKDFNLSMISYLFHAFTLQWCTSSNDDHVWLLQEMMLWRLMTYSSFYY